MEILKTKRLRVRYLTLDDANFILALMNEPAYIENIGDKKIRTTDAAREHLKTGPIQSYAENGFGLNCVELLETGEPIGICGLIKRPALDDVDFGYAFLSQHWSNGYALEAATALLADTRKAKHLKKLVAIVNPENDSSIRLLKRLGFRFQERIEFGDEKALVNLFKLDL